MSSINYDLEKIKGIVFDVDGVLSPSTIPLGEAGYPRRMANIKDGYALQLAVRKGYSIAIITGGKDIAIRKRFESLGITDIYTDVPHKLPVLSSWMDDKNLKPEEVAYMGDDIPDLQCLRHVGLPSSPFDACREVRQTSIFVSKFSGGYGCARDLLEQIMKAQDHWLTDQEAFKW